MHLSGARPQTRSLKSPGSSHTHSERSASQPSRNLLSFSELVLTYSHCSPPINSQRLPVGWHAELYVCCRSSLCPQGTMPFTSKTTPTRPRRLCGEISVARFCLGLAGCGPRRWLSGHDAEGVSTCAYPCTSLRSEHEKVTSML